MKKIHIFIYLIFTVLSISAQPLLRISQIQTASGSSLYLNQTVKTVGVVTVKFQNTGEIGGFFIQDTVRNGNDSISDGLFIHNTSFKDNFAVGDWVEVTGKVIEYLGMTELSTVSAVNKIASGCALPFVRMKFPAEWTDWKRLAGMLIRFDQRLIVNMTRNTPSNGRIGLSSVRRRAETEYFIRRDAETASYDSMFAYNSRDYVLLGSGRNGKPTVIPFADSTGILRTGQGIDTLWAVVYPFSSNQYLLLPAKNPILNGNPRPTAIDTQKLNHASLKICSYNLENYFGAKITEDKTKKVIKGLTAIDADIFGFCETQQGDKTVDTLVSALNAVLGQEIYANYPLNVPNNAFYSGVSIIYKKDRVKPNGNPWFTNNPTPKYRKFFVSFEEISTKEKFIISINHLKAKTGTGSGEDADQGDGQSLFNAARINEANAIMDYFRSAAKTEYGTNRMIIMGDLNSLANEDPIRIFKNEGFVNQNERFSTSEYSYVYNDKVQYLDYVMTNDSLSKYVRGATVFHINSDELSIYADDTSMYRCSDHDPVIIGLNFKIDTSFTGIKSQNQPDEMFTLIPNPSQGNVQIVLENTKFNIIQVFDMSGREVYSETLSQATHRHEISLQKLAKGYYLIRIVTENGRVLEKKGVVM
jgi:predicted extracellular nuclease